MVAVNSVGQSPSSEPVVIKTEGESPSGVPTNLIAIPLSSKEIQLKWTVPDQATWHGRLLGYNIGIKQAKYVVKFAKLFYKKIILTVFIYVLCIYV